MVPLAAQTKIDWSQIRTPPDLPYTDVVQTWTALQNFNAGLTATTGHCWQGGSFGGCDGGAVALCSFDDLDFFLWTGNEAGVKDYWERAEKRNREWERTHYSPVAHYSTAVQFN